MTALTVFLCVIAAVMLIIGFLGAILPALPGPPLSWFALLLVYFAIPGGVSETVLVFMLLLTAFVTVLDYVAPAVTTKWGGGSKAAVWGATLGAVAGLFFAPWGLVLGPLVCAFIAEYIQEQNLGKSVRVALWSFLAFLITTGLKLVACLWIAWYCLVPIWHMIF